MNKERFMQGSKINSMLTIEYMCNEKENQFFNRYCR